MKVLKGMSLILSSLCLRMMSSLHVSEATSGMFEDVSDTMLAGLNTRQKNYGVAVADVDHDGEMEWIVAGYRGPNLVLKYDHTQQRLANIALPGTPYEALRDERGNAIGVCACDLDGDGWEEIYFLNTNGAFSGQATYGDKLLKMRDGAYVDLFSDSVNRHVTATMYAGRSVACVDRQGTGKYAFALATYAYGPHGQFGLLEIDEEHASNDVNNGRIVLKNVAVEAGIDLPTGGRGITVGPILNQEGYSDMFFDNEGGPNFLFRNNRDGTFTDVAAEKGISDSRHHGRGVALADFNLDGKIDIVYGNWMGYHRLFLQRDNGRFENVATPTFATPSAIRTVMAADFDNDGILEVLMNNIFYRGPQPNSLYRVVPSGNDVDIQPLEIGDALEPHGFGTGGATGDLDGDGTLEVILAHGESGTQPLTVFKVPNASTRYLRIMPKTLQGAPARGALVSVKMDNETTHSRVIDAGSGYLCQMEPVAHFGLGESSHPVEMTIRWPDGQSLTRTLGQGDENRVHMVDHPVQSPVEDERVYHEGTLRVVSGQSSMQK